MYGQTYHCWKKKGHGFVSLRNAMKQSCDTYFYEIARRLGVDKLSETAKKFGLGEKVFGNIFNIEKSGLVPDTQWKKNALGKGWLLGETMITGIGQGYIQTTPIQLCLMTAQIANGGFKIYPKIIVDDKTNDQPVDKVRFRKSDYFPELEKSFNDAVSKLHEIREHEFGELRKVREYMDNLAMIVPEDKKIVIGEITTHPSRRHHGGWNLDDLVDFWKVVPHVLVHAKCRDTPVLAWVQYPDETLFIAFAYGRHVHRTPVVRRFDVHCHFGSAGVTAIEFFHLVNQCDRINNLVRPCAWGRDQTHQNEQADTESVTRSVVRCAVKQTHAFHG